MIKYIKLFLLCLICFWSCNDDDDVIEPTDMDDVVIDATDDGIIDPIVDPEPQQTLFEWPLKQSNNFDDYSYYYISNHVDHDSSSGTLDYNGGTRTYNGHRGTDIVVYPFWWRKQIEQQVEVIAATGGILIEKEDGFFDQNCAWEGKSANRIKIQHLDGSTASYVHFKKNSLTSKLIGESISVGEFLGYVGSSGNSTVPHLHFEVRSANGDLVDPFKGASNPTTDTSWWTKQTEYQDSGMNKIVISSIAPEDSGNDCPNPEETNEKFDFLPNDRIVFTRYYRHAVAEQKTTCTIYKPDGSIWDSWNHNHSETKKRRYIWNSRILPSNAQTGLWTFESIYLDKVYIKTFNVL